MSSRTRSLVSWSVGATVVVVGAVIVAALVAGELPRSSSWAVAPVVAAALFAAAAGAMAQRWSAAGGSGGRAVGADGVDPLRNVDASELPVPEMLEQFGEGLVRTYGADSAELWLHRGGGAIVREAAVPAAGVARLSLDPGALHVLESGGVVGRGWAELFAPDLLPSDGRQLRLAPAVHGGRLQGLVVLVGGDGTRFGPVGDRSLADLATRFGVLLHNRELDSALQGSLDDLRTTNDELRASRVRLVAAADAERRRIERDLHDGAQQHLVAVAVNLGLARQAIIDDPGAAPELLDELGAEVREAIAQLRSLAQGIYPPLLISAGLSDAIRTAADRSPSKVTVTISSLGRYSTEVEAAVYFCCVEALQNAAKHASGCPVRIELGEEDGILSFSVEDEGPGLPDPPPESGQGLMNMADRIGAVGGTLTIGAAHSGGARVSGSIPLDERR